MMDGGRMCGLVGRFVWGLGLCGLIGWLVGWSVDWLVDRWNERGLYIYGIYDWEAGKGKIENKRRNECLCFFLLLLSLHSPFALHWLRVAV